jgi:hypothetical protein
MASCCSLSASRKITILNVKKKEEKKVKLIFSETCFELNLSLNLDIDNNDCGLERWWWREISTLALEIEPPRDTIANKNNKKRVNRAWKCNKLNLNFVFHFSRFTKLYILQQQQKKKQSWCDVMMEKWVRSRSFSFNSIAIVMSHNRVMCAESFNVVFFLFLYASLLSSLLNFLFRCQSATKYDIAICFFKA